MNRAFRSAGDAPNPPEGRRPRPASPLLSDPRGNAAAANVGSMVQIAYATPVAMNRQHPDIIQFLQDKVYLNEYFAQYLAGATVYPNRMHMVYRLPDQHEKRIVGAWENIYKLEMPLAAQLPNERRGLPGAGGASARGSLIGEMEKKEALMEFSAGGFNVRILKVLGMGGMGVAFLLEAFGTKWTPDTGKRTKFVLKYDVGAVDMTEEKRLMMNFRRSKHVIQMLKVEDIWPDEALQPQFVDWTNIINNHSSLQMLEYMKNGDMGLILDKIAHSDTAHMIREQGFFAKQCWKIFICLIRACIDMQYPPRRRINPDTGAVQRLSEDGESLNGGIPFQTPGGPLPPGFEVIHFDIDPQNILIGDFDADGHQGVPVFKIADFGLAVRTTDLPFNYFAHAIQLRKRGKPFWYLPEQYTREWEFVDVIPSMQNPRPQVAGNFGPASNVFAMGNCMLELLTGFHHPFPPRARGPVNSPAGSDDFPKDFLVCDLYGRPVPSFWTHGFPLRDVNTDVLLRDTIMRCLADKPADRPDLQELSELIDFLEKQDNWDAKDDWIDFGLYFQHPPQPPPDVDNTPLGGWEEFYPENQPSAPSRGNVGVFFGGGTGRPLGPNVPLGDVWNQGVRPPQPQPAPPPAAASPGRARSSVQAPAGSNSQAQGLGQISQPLLTGGLSSDFLPSEASSPVRSVVSEPRQSQSGRQIPQRPIASGTSADGTSQYSTAYLQALAAVGIFPSAGAPSQSSSKRPRTLDPPVAANISQASSPDIGDLRRKLRALQANSGGAASVRLPVGDKTTDAGTLGEALPHPAPTTPTQLPVAMDVDSSPVGISTANTSSDTPFFSPQAQTSSPISPTRQRPARPLRRVPRRPNLRPMTSVSSGSPPQRNSVFSSLLQQQDSTVFNASSMLQGGSAVTEEVHHLDWPPDRQQRRGGILRRVIDRTRRMGRNIVAVGGERRGRRDRQRAALKLGLSRESAAAAAGDDSAGDGSNAQQATTATPASYAGIMTSPSNGREVFYVPPRGYVVPGFRRADWGNVAGERQYTYFYDPSSVTGQMILDAARQGLIPSQSQLMN